MKHQTHGWTRLHGRRTGQRRDNVAACLGLPERVGDTAPAVAHEVVEPEPGLWVDRLANGTEDLQGKTL